MADFDLNQPFTFRPSKTNFAGSYSYTARVTPDDPTRYKGPQFITVTSNSLLSENEILERASNIALSRSRYEFSGGSLDIDITDAIINVNLIPEI